MFLWGATQGGGSRTRLCPGLFSCCPFGAPGEQRTEGMGLLEDRELTRPKLAFYKDGAGHGKWQMENGKAEGEGPT